MNVKPFRSLRDATSALSVTTLAALGGDHAPVYQCPHRPPAFSLVFFFDQNVRRGVKFSVLEGGAIVPYIEPY